MLLSQHLGGDELEKFVHHLQVKLMRWGGDMCMSGAWGYHKDFVDVHSHIKEMKLPPLCNTRNVVWSFFTLNKDNNR